MNLRVIVSEDDTEILAAHIDHTPWAVAWVLDSLAQRVRALASSTETES